jgi:hypothetical protein
VYHRSPFQPTVLTGQPSSPAGFRSSEEEPARGNRTAGEDSIWRQGSAACPTTETAAPGRPASARHELMDECIDVAMFSGARCWRCASGSMSWSLASSRKFPGRGKGGKALGVWVSLGMPFNEKGGRQNARRLGRRPKMDASCPDMRTGGQAQMQTCNRLTRQKRCRLSALAVRQADRWLGTLAGCQTGHHARCLPCCQANMQTGNKAKMQPAAPILLDRWDA